MELETRAARGLESGGDPTDAQFRLLVETVSDYAIYLLDPTGHVMSWNTGAERIKGYAAREIMGRSFAVFYPLEDREAGLPERNLAQARREGRFTSHGWRLRKDGTRFWADVVITALRNRAGELTGFAKVTRDITERKRAEQSLLDAEAELQSLTRRLVQAEESERRRIAGELHDRVGQTLSALNINLDILLGMLGESAPPDVRMRLRDSLALVDGTLQSIENVMAELRPPLLEEYGVGAALGWHAEEFSRRTGIEIEFEDLAKQKNRQLPREAGVALFRISQEALNNVAKHANARRVTLRLEPVGTDMVLTIQDDGDGFDPAKQGRSSRYGMTTMKERVMAAGGQLEVDSTPGKGTTLRAKVPF